MELVALSQYVLYCGCVFIQVWEGVHVKLTNLQSHLIQLMLEVDFSCQRRNDTFGVTRKGVR